MGSGQSNALKGKTVEEQAILVESRSEEEAKAETEETKKAISLDWHHPTRAMEDHFTLLSKKPIGRGHFADVFLGQAINSGRKGLNLEVGQLVAVKHVYRSRCSEENLHKEVDAMLEIATRHHPNIVALLDAFLTPDKLILVLEYCPGGELFEHLAGEGPYSEQAASEMVKQMAHVLHFLHTHNCTHRDLKPENVLLMNTDDDEGLPLIKVADFGLATMKKEPFMTSVCGTWAYCAPEVCLLLLVEKACVIIYVGASSAVSAGGVILLLLRCLFLWRMVVVHLPVCPLTVHVSPRVAVVCVLVGAQGPRLHQVRGRVELGCDHFYPRCTCSEKPVVCLLFRSRRLLVVVAVVPR